MSRGTNVFRPYDEVCMIGAVASLNYREDKPVPSPIHT